MCMCWPDPRIATLKQPEAVLKVGTDEFFVTNISTRHNRHGYHFHASVTCNRSFPGSRWMFTRVRPEHELFAYTSSVSLAVR